MTIGATKLLSYSSTVALIISVGLLVYARTVDPDPHTSRLHLGYNVAVTAYGGGSILIFNDAKIGPYTGGTVEILSSSDIAAGKSRASGFGPICGVHFQHIKGIKGGNDLWTLRVSLWYSVVIFGIWPFVGVLRLSDRSRNSGKGTSQALF
jgi:hypothetical protein